MRLVRGSKSGLILSAVLLCALSVYSRGSTEAEDFSRVKSGSDRAALKRYLDIYRDGANRAEAELRYAKTAADIEEQTDILENYLKRFTEPVRNREAYRMLAECYFLKGEFSSLSALSARYYARGGRERFMTVFRVRAQMLSQNYAAAWQEMDKNGDGFPAAMRAFAQKRTTGNSAHIQRLRSEPSAITAPSLYVAGIFLEEDGFINEAYSAFTDLTRRFPRSPEAVMAGRKLALLSERHPVYTADYLKPSAPLAQLTHESDIADTPGAGSFSVEVGPLYNLEEAKQLRKEIGTEYGRTLIVKRRREFVLLVGLFATSDRALNAKIRLAQEAGINGHVVQLRGMQTEQ
jgi:hypothetical protein